MRLMRKDNFTVDYLRLPYVWRNQTPSRPLQSWYVYQSEFTRHHRWHYDLSNLYILAGCMKTATNDFVLINILRYYLLLVSGSWLMRSVLAMPKKYR